MPTPMPRKMQETSAARRSSRIVRAKGLAAAALLAISCGFNADASASQQPATLGDSAFNNASADWVADLESAAMPKQSIVRFSPTSGDVGTVITLTGSGFTRSDVAWVGSAHDVALIVVSDTEARFTVPADGTSGLVAILNPQYAAFTAGTFTITATAKAMPQQLTANSSPATRARSTAVSPTGTDFSDANTADDRDPVAAVFSADSFSGITNTMSMPTPVSASAGGLSLRVLDSHLIDNNGGVVQLRGVNLRATEDGDFEFAAHDAKIAEPDYAAIKSSNANALRIPLNEASWLGYTCTDTRGAVRNTDADGDYKTAVKQQVDRATAAGLYVVLVLHQTAADHTCPMPESSPAFWTSVAGLFKNDPSVVFELFNDSFEDIKQIGAFANYQVMIDTVRATGATNVVLVGAPSHAQDLSGWLAQKPKDPLKQMGAAWHPSRPVQSAEDYPYPTFYPQVFNDAQAILAMGIPLVMTQVGGQNTPRNSPIVVTMTRFADDNGASIFGGV